MGGMALQMGADGIADEQGVTAAAAAEAALTTQDQMVQTAMALMIEPQPEISSVCSCPRHSYSPAMRKWCASSLAMREWYAYRSSLHGIPSEH